MYDDNKYRLPDIFCSENKLYVRFQPTVFFLNQCNQPNSSIILSLQIFLIIAVAHEAHRFVIKSRWKLTIRKCFFWCSSFANLYRLHASAIKLICPHKPGGIFVVSTIGELVTFSGSCPRRIDT